MQDRAISTVNIAGNKINAAEIPWKYIKPVTEDAVEYHLAIIDIAKQIENTFNLLVLLIMLSGIVLIGSLLYRLGGVICNRLF